jgi:hypothetical protein
MRRDDHVNDAQRNASDDAAAPGDVALTHTVRPNLFTKELTYRLEPDALSWSRGEKSGRVPYAAILRAHIYSQPPYRGQTTRRTILRGKFPGKLTIQAMHYGGLGNVDDRADSYFPFVEALLARVEAANPALAVRVGQPWPLYVFFVVLFAFFILMVPLMILILFDGDGNLGALWGLLFVGVMLPMMWKLVSRGRPRKADAGALYTHDIGGRRG